MKVIIFSSGFYEYIIELANALSDLTTIVLCVPENKLSERHFSLISEKIICEKFVLVDYKSLRDNYKMLNQIRKIIKTHNPDLIHIQAHGLKNFYLLYPFFYTKKLINTIHDVTTHSGDLLSKQNNINNYLINKIAYHNIVHGNSLRNEAEKKLKISKNKISVINHGHLGIYKNWRFNNHDKQNNTFLFFGRIWPYKGLNYFIKAANLLAEENNKVKFIIAGKGENIKPYINLIQNKTIFEIRNYRLSETEIDELFQKSKFVVLPYIDATQSGVIPIAFNYKTLVISTNVGSLPEIIKDQETGLLCNPKDHIGLYEKMKYAVNNLNKIDSFIDNAFRQCGEKLKWSNIAQETYTIYKH